MVRHASDIALKINSAGTNLASPYLTSAETFQLHTSENAHKICWVILCIKKTYKLELTEGHHVYQAISWFWFYVLTRMRVWAHITQDLRTKCKHFAPS